MKTFEEYLKEVHMVENPEILKDDLLDAFNDWVIEIQADDWIKYAEKWHSDIIQEIRKDVEEIGEILNP